MTQAFALVPTTLADASTTEVATSFLPGRSVGAFAMGDTDLTCPSCASALVRGVGDVPNRLFAGVALRCPCGSWSRIPDGTPWSALPGTLEARPIGPLYRYFSSDTHRQAFLDGDVWTTTVYACREHPDDTRADSGEGTLQYTHDPVYGFGRNPHVREIARRIGVAVGPNTEIMMKDCSVHRESSNAWMLCVSREFSPTLMRKFGAYCVRIERPAALFTAMADVIAQSTPLWLGGYRRVHYRARNVRNLEAEPGSEVFVKPPSYAEEAEMRFLWLPAQPTPLMPRIFNVDVQPAALTALPVLSLENGPEGDVGRGHGALTEVESRIWRAAVKRFRRGQRRK